MKPEAADYLDKAREDLDDARKIAAIELAKVAARCAYYAAFHAAEALIVERAGKIVKTHSGVIRPSVDRFARRRPPLLPASGEKVRMRGRVYCPLRSKPPSPSP